MQNKVKIIFENDDVVVVNKESNVFVYKEDAKNLKKNTLLDFVENNCGKKLIPVSSLDFEATGIVVLAKNEKAYNFIAEQFKNNHVEKTYYIIVNGIMENTEGEIDKKLLVTEQTTSVNDKGVNAVTKYSVVEQFKNFAFVKVVPMTTRKNQIRTHFWSIGNTLAIDKIYGSDEPILLSSLKRRYKGISKEKPLLKRLPLHLYQMSFVIPGEKEKRIFTADLPEDFEVTLKQLRKYNSSFVQSSNLPIF